MSKLTVNLVVWNGEKYIPYLFQSLRQQTFKDWQMNILDNGSSDQTVAAVKKELVDFPVPVNFEINRENTGFSPAYNGLSKKSSGQYILLLNQDIYLLPDVFEKLVSFLDNNLSCAVVAPRLMRWDFSKISSGLPATFTEQVDALGMKVFRSRRVMETGTGEKWPLPGFEKKSMEVFGLSAALLAIRKSVVEKVSFSNGMFFDESYHSYKEDVDLAFRLRSSGFNSFVLPDVVAYHDRTVVSAEGDLSDAAAARNKNRQTFFAKYHSYKNHLATLYKNEYWQNVFFDFPFIKWYETKKFMYYLFFKPSVLKGLGELIKNRRLLQEMKKEIKEKRVCAWRDLRKWWK